jgi:hypothetical protein
VSHRPPQRLLDRPSQPIKVDTDMAHGDLTWRQLDEAVDTETADTRRQLMVIEPAPSTRRRRRFCEPPREEFGQEGDWRGVLACA